MDSNGTLDRPVARCVMVEDSPVLRGALRAYLASEGIDVVAEAPDATDVLAAINVHSADLVLLDARMPGASGIEIASEVATARPDVTLVLYTGVVDEALISASLAAGITGIALKGATPTSLLDVIEGALAGEVSIDRQLLPGWHDERSP